MKDKTSSSKDGLREQLYRGLNHQNTKTKWKRNKKQKQES